MTNKHQKTRRKKRFSDFIVYIAISMIIGYTIAALVLQFKGLMEISTTLTSCWYGFWTAEIITLGSIKNTKTNKEAKKNENNTESYTESR